MDTLLPPAGVTEQDRLLTEVVASERGRLLRFIRRYLADEDDAEDILQEVFYELVDAYRLMKPIEQLGAWLTRVARNRIIDRFRRRTTRAPAIPEITLGEEQPLWEELLPAENASPEEAFAREVLLDQLELAILELPQEQRRIFIAHEFEGKSFKELADELGVSINTLLARKHAAVKRLRQRLLAIYQDYGGTQ